MSEPVPVGSLPCGCRFDGADDTLVVTPCGAPQHEEMLYEVVREIAAEREIPLELVRKLDS